MNRDELISQFVSITNASPEEAQHYLSTSSWTLDSAIADFYAARDDPQDDTENDPDDMEDDNPSITQTQALPQHQSVSGGGRRLGDGPSDSTHVPPAPSSSSLRPVKKQPQKKFATLGDFNSGAANDDDEEDERQDFFTGGEKSGLAVHNPNADDLKKRILEKARKAGPPPRDDDEPKKSHFAGSARTLGGDDTPSRQIAAPQQPRTRAERVERILHFWQDGFSIDDGDLYRIDDQRNAEILNLIRQGRAPLSIMNVEPGQEVDVEIKQHDEKYVKPKPKYKPFSGSGQRLGSPTPGVSSPSMPGAFVQDTATTATTANAPATSTVDELQPTLTLRISMASGTRMTSRFNTAQTIGDVYDFVTRAESGGRSFVLQTTFPTTELTDKSKVLGEMQEFKRGGAVVQKYV